jgi:hypothetical protein
MKQVEIRFGGVLGGTHNDDKIVVDGHDISKGINEITVHGKVGDLTTVEIDAPLVDITTFDGEAKVYIHPATVESLIALGWTPPADDADQPQ